MSEELKPCPFCAGKPYVQENGRMSFRYWEVVYDNECDFTGPAKDTKQQAVEAWNRRDPDAAKDAEIGRQHEEILRLQMLAWRWQEAHDCLKEGIPYSFPSPSDQPKALAEIEKLKEALTEKRRDRIGDAELGGSYLCRAEKAEAEISALGQDVVDLVIADREFWDANNDLSEESKALDKALEPFASKVRYANEPEDMREASHA